MIFICIQGVSQQTVGLFINEADSSDGYTLFSSNKKTYLIDNCGYQVNVWNSEYNPGACAYLMEDASLLRSARIGGGFSAGGTGGRFELFDWKGELTWSFDISNENEHAHHDISILPNGNFLALVWDRMDEEVAIQHGREQLGYDVWLEKIVEIRILEDGNADIIWEWKLRDHLIQEHDENAENFGVVKDHPELMDFNFLGPLSIDREDWIHANGISYNPELDQIAISCKYIGEIWIIDHSTTTEEAAGHLGGNSNNGGDFLYRYGNPQTYQRGTPEDQIFKDQHNVTWLNNRQLMVFNNNFEGGISGIHQWSLPISENNHYQLPEEESFGPATFDWNFAEAGFYSEIMSSAELQPNGNILICFADNGRFVELTQEKEIVWEYINPTEANNYPVEQGNLPYFNKTFHITRYPTDMMGFQDKEIDAQWPIEINPLDYECTPLGVVSVDNEIDRELMNLLYNPIDELLLFELNIPVGEFLIYNMLLQPQMRIDTRMGLNQANVSHLQAGTYLIFSKDSRQLGTQTFIKI